MYFSLGHTPLSKAEYTLSYQNVRGENGVFIVSLSKPSIRSSPIDDISFPFLPIKSNLSLLIWKEKPSYPLETEREPLSKRTSTLFSFSLKAVTLSSPKSE